MKHMLPAILVGLLVFLFCGTAGAETLEKKVNKIIIKEIDVEDGKTKDVFELIRAKSKEADPEGKGINFVFQDMPDAGEITLKLTDVPLIKVIEYVCIASKLKFKIDTHAVIISKEKPAEKKKIDK